MLANVISLLEVPKESVNMNGIVLQIVCYFAVLASVASRAGKQILRRVDYSV